MNMDINFEKSVDACGTVITLAAMMLNKGIPCSLSLKEDTRLTSNRLVFHSKSGITYEVFEGCGTSRLRYPELAIVQNTSGVDISVVNMDKCAELADDIVRLALGLEMPINIQRKWG
jgi:hypothetical protein